MIVKVVLFNNGMVMVFGEDGQQMPEFQGHVTEVGPQILSNDTGATQYVLGSMQSPQESWPDLWRTKFVMESQADPPDWVIEQQNTS